MDLPRLRVSPHAVDDSHPALGLIQISLGCWRYLGRQRRKMLAALDRFHRVIIAAIKSYVLSQAVRDGDDFAEGQLNAWLPLWGFLLASRIVVELNIAIWGTVGFLQVAFEKVL